MQSISTGGLALAMVVALSLAVGCGKKTSSTEPPKSESVNASPTPTPTPNPTPNPGQPKEKPNIPKPDFTTSAVEVTKAYADDFAAADKKYDKKVVRVKGKIIGFDRGELEVHLQGTSAYRVEGRMGLGFDSIVKAKKVGDEITIQGQVDTVRDNRLVLILAVWVPE